MVLIVLKRLAPVLLGEAAGRERSDRGPYKREHKIEDAVSRSLGVLLRVSDTEKVASIARHSLDGRRYSAARQVIQDFPERRCAVVRMQLDFVELSVYPIGIGDRPLARIAAAEKGEFDPAIVVHFLDAPISAVLAVPEDLGAEIISGPVVNVALAHPAPHRV